MSKTDFYISHSIFTSPGIFFYLFYELPENIPDLCTVIQNLFLHMADEALFNYKIPLMRFSEMDTRYANRWLRRLSEDGAKPLSVYRDIPHRMIGICRDIALLVCSVLRQRHIPARLRVGFADYFTPGIYLDGIWLEYWNENQKRWYVVDTRTTLLHIEKYRLQLDFDRYDIPPGKVLPAELAWKLCRENRINTRYIGARDIRGLWYVRNRLIQALAFLNKYEILTWDVWGLMRSGTEIPAEQYPLLDDLSVFLLKNSTSPQELIHFYEANPLFQVQKSVLVCNPAYSTPRLDPLFF
ncbi:MAG: hypothetical protein A3F10_00380 [Coxiella sp. RIFCSPHIGHO2_12_FULL_42_15]|nr:MAG: hypothetical protein A3F10_00380 [Coxiella sp. RIFCSPHIGHO2_12_FULL_42_15]